MTGLVAAAACAALLPMAAEAARPAAPAPAPAADARPATSASAAAPRPFVPGEAARAVSCGPEVTSPGGVEAQTCVERGDAGDVRGRTYYRNATGTEMRLVLTLMAPGGRTVETYCAVPAEDDPGVCETPEEPDPGVKQEEYAAVAEFAGKGPGGRFEDGPLLLRSGSNLVDPDGS
ncbi:hypothetical protein [Streptomyces sp. ODS05-4]|uniref:hypothetical protein n=1 Tax=Streptomyces sp. ODS05-4 TaxID=2944939 RepID=UPI00210AA2AC|nr:hypothetical protein [Streptomyces sp. ODS05-4]